MAFVLLITLVISFHPFPDVEGSEMGQAGCCMCTPSCICSILSSDGAWGLQRNGWYALLHYYRLRCTDESGQEAGEPSIVKAVGAGRRSRASLSLVDRQHTTSSGQWRLSSELRRSFKWCLRNPGGYLSSNFTCREAELHTADMRLSVIPSK